MMISTGAAHTASFVVILRAFFRFSEKMSAMRNAASRLIASPVGVRRLVLLSADSANAHRIAEAALGGKATIKAPPICQIYNPARNREIDTRGELCQSYWRRRGLRDTAFCDNQIHRQRFHLGRRQSIGP
jgi:hypothetical protein